MGVTINSILLDQVFRQLDIPASARRQFQLASSLCDVNGRGFPKELFQLSAPVITRGLLNYGIFQMKREWVFPFWVHRQLDPSSSSFVARSQNPLMMNITHRNWTALGTPHGTHEAIVDPRGLLTPLPREWSIDTWLVANDDVLFPSLASHADQRLDPVAPRLTTSLRWRDFVLRLEAFVLASRSSTDVVFFEASVENTSLFQQRADLCLAVRPFNPEGVAPIEQIKFPSPRVIAVDGAVGVVLAEDPHWHRLGSGVEGDTATFARNMGKVQSPRTHSSSIQCEAGFANAVAGYRFELPAGGRGTIHGSIALASERVLKRVPVKQSWRVTYEHRKKEHKDVWRREQVHRAHMHFGDQALQHLFDASALTLLQLQDADTITPGPFLYHHFWFRDAVPMLRALDVLGLHDRVRGVMNSFPQRLTQDGFFRGPNGEWDSNGAVLWMVHQHYRIARSTLWLKQLYPVLKRAGTWIQRMRRSSSTAATTMKGLMPKSLSAEHLGTVDHYYWDSFWSLAGLRALAALAHEAGQQKDADAFIIECRLFSHDILQSLEVVHQRLGRRLIPASPTRAFDESAIGSLCAVYPLAIEDVPLPGAVETVHEVYKRFVDERGFFHPIIHSGYNPYLTLQLAHSFLQIGEPEKAWKVARNVFAQASPTFSFPEAIHPRTGGGSMGDGHHGWAAAEVILFLRDCLLRETPTSLEIFRGAGPFLKQSLPLRIHNAPTAFGRVNCDVSFESRHRCILAFNNTFPANRAPSSIEVFLPFGVKRVLPSSPTHLLRCTHATSTTRLSLSPQATMLLLEINP